MADIESVQQRYNICSVPCMSGIQRRKKDLHAAAELKCELFDEFMSTELIGGGISLCYSVCTKTAQLWETIDG